MLNHIEIQGRVENVREAQRDGKTEIRFSLIHQRGYDPMDVDRFECVYTGSNMLMRGGMGGRTAIVTGQLRSGESGAEIFCWTGYFVDGGGRDGS